MSNDNQNPEEPAGDRPAEAAPEVEGVTPCPPTVELQTSGESVIRWKAEYDAAHASLGELHAALVRYEADVDGEAPSEHRQMMDRAAAILFPENDPSSATRRQRRMNTNETQSPVSLERMVRPRLWRVTVEYTLLVVADNERQAEDEAEYNAGEDGSEPDITIANEVRSIEDVPVDWQDSIPFGGDSKDERTCRERIASRSNGALSNGGTDS